MDGYFEILDNGREYSNFNYSIRYVINLTVSICEIELYFYIRTPINRSIERNSYLWLLKRWLVSCYWIVS